MKVPEETICGVCKQIFCCENCRKKHELKTHPKTFKNEKHDENSFLENNLKNTSNLLHVSCPICLNQAFPLRANLYDASLLEHIEHKHLPLHCQKCAKIYTKISDLHEFSKCFSSKTKKVLTVEEENLILKDNFGKKQVINNTKIERKTQLTTISTQTSPMLLPHSASNKATQEFSFPSMKNNSLSSTNNFSFNRRSSIGIVALQADIKGKLVRTTSTPVHLETEHAKPKDPTFNSTGAQVSSIYNSGCDIDIDKNSPMQQRLNIQQPETLNAYRKFSTRPKIAAVTPLRQVMSKSIQKAFAEHALRPSFDHKKHEVQEACAALTNLPLDLRLSPALRRCQSGSFIPSTKSVIHEVADAESEFDSDTAVSSTSGDSVYKTCHSVEIIVTSEISQIELHDENNIEKIVNKQLEKPRKIASLGINTPITRMPAGANVINKKLIKFETPNNLKKNYESKGENFYTPSCGNMGSPIDSAMISAIDSSISSSTKRQLSKCSLMCRPSIRECAQSTQAISHTAVDTDYDSNDEVFLTPNAKSKSTIDQGTQSGNGLIWSFMSSVLQKGTRYLDNKRLTFNVDDQPNANKSLIKRCASIAGSLVRSTSLLDEKQLQPMKRKRTNTFDSQTSPSSGVRRMESLPNNIDGYSRSKRFRLQGRKPIERMRNTSL